MKKALFKSFCCMAAVAATCTFSACADYDNPLSALGEHEARPDIPVNPKGHVLDNAVQTGATSNVGLASVVLSGTIDMSKVENLSASYTTGVQVATDEAFTKDVRYYEQMPQEDGTVNAVCTSLVAATKYYYRTYIESEGKYHFGTAADFTTKDFENIAQVATPYAAGSYQYVTVCDVDTNAIDYDVLPGQTRFVGMAYSKTKNNLTAANIEKWIEEQWEDRQNATITVASDDQWQIVPVEEAKDGKITITTEALNMRTNYYYVPFTCVGGSYDDSPMKVKVKLGTVAAKAVQTSILVPTAKKDFALVDLGLSVKWYNANISEANGYAATKRYQWGATNTSTAEKSYSLETEDISGNPLYDIATLTDPTLRMPTAAEMQELIDKCKWIKMQYYSTTNPGYLVVGPNGNSIFLPLALNATCDYWTSTPVDGSSELSYCLGVYYVDSANNFRKLDGSCSRYAGFMVRPVENK